MNNGLGRESHAYRLVVKGEFEDGIRPVRHVTRRHVSVSAQRFDERRRGEGAKTKAQSLAYPLSQTHHKVSVPSARSDCSKAPVCNRRSPLQFGFFNPNGISVSRRVLGNKAANSVSHGLDNPFIVTFAEEQAKEWSSLAELYGPTEIRRLLRVVGDSNVRNTALNADW